MDRNKILIIDDEEDILKLTALRLKKSGYNVITAANGIEGLSTMFDKKPDLVLLDLSLPDINGADICRKAKSCGELKNIQIVLFTASSSSMTAEKAKKPGADDFLVKPFEPEELLEKVGQLLPQETIA